MSHYVRITSLAFASALAWTATAAEPAGSSSEPSSASSTASSPPSADLAGTHAPAKADKPLPLPLHQIEGNGGVSY